VILSQTSVNWKAYWGLSAGKASIVHFHGPKPREYQAAHEWMHAQFGRIRRDKWDEYWRHLGRKPWGPVAGLFLKCFGTVGCYDFTRAWAEELALAPPMADASSTTLMPSSPDLGPPFGFPWTALSDKVGLDFTSEWLQRAPARRYGAATAAIPASASAAVLPLSINVLVMQSDFYFRFLYEPVASTLAAAFLRYMRYTELNLTWAFEVKDTDRKSGSSMRERMLERTAYLQRGDVFLWLGAHGKVEKGVPLQELRERGVYTIYYRTEPFEPCQRPGLGGLDETWEYTHVNVRQKCEHARPLSRFVPPGANELSLNRFRPPAGDNILTFVGHVGMGMLRAQCFQNLTAELGNSVLVSEYNMKSEDAFATRLTNRTFFLNIHKKCGWADMPLESLRLAKLLNYGGIILSETSHPEDEAAFRGLVTFAQPSDLGREYRRVVGMSHAQRLELARSTRDEFMRRSEPSRVFQAAGVYKMLDKRLAERRDARSRLERIWRGQIDQL
jgi:hypothetical protein